MLAKTATKTSVSFYEAGVKHHLPRFSTHAIYNLPNIEISLDSRRPQVQKRLDHTSKKYDR